MHAQAAGSDGSSGGERSSASSRSRGSGARARANPRWLEPQQRSGGAKSRVSAASSQLRQVPPQERSLLPRHRCRDHRHRSRSACRRSPPSQPRRRRRFLRGGSSSSSCCCSVPRLPPRAPRRRAATRDRLLPPRLPLLPRSLCVALSRRPLRAASPPPAACPCTWAARRRAARARGGRSRVQLDVVFLWRVLAVCQTPIKVSHSNPTQNRTTQLL